MSDTTAPQVTADTDRYGRPLPADPEATRVEANPVGVHILILTPNKYALADLAAGAGLSWLTRGRWTTDHVLHVPLRGGDRWHIGYSDDTAIVNHGEGMPRTQGRHLYAVADSSSITADPNTGTAADIRRWKAAGMWHEAAVGDLVVLQCYAENRGTGVVELVETIAARIGVTAWGGTHLALFLVERDS
jgi:hypothetical protein